MTIKKVPLLKGTLCLALALCVSATSLAGSREQAKRIHDRLVGTPPSADCLNQMATTIDGSAATGAFDAALDAIDINNANDQCTDAAFYNVTLKNFITPWTNEPQDAFAPLNDYSATLIGLIRDEADFKNILHDNVLYVGQGSLGLPAYAIDNNTHYQTMENRGIDLRENLVAIAQSSANGLTPEGTAGIMTTRAAAKAFFIDGTNRAMFRFTMLNHLCIDLEQMKDSTRAHDRVRQDVSRSPGGDSRIFMNACVGCHAGMDPLTQALASYNYDYDSEADPTGDNGRLVHTPGSVQAKFLINANNFKYGYVTADDRWDNYWREGPNAFLGWSPTGSGSGNGAKSMGQELANSEAFARCQVQKVFQNVCLRSPVNAGDDMAFEQILGNFKTTYNYSLKHVFAESAAYCKGD